MSSRITPVFITAINRALSPTAQGTLVKPNELASALQRPAFMAYYQSDSSAPQRAASLAYGIIMGHPFLDANKRTAFWAVNEYLKEQIGKGLTDIPLAANTTDAAMQCIGDAHNRVAQNLISSEDLGKIYEQVLRSR